MRRVVMHFLLLILCIDAVAVMAAPSPGGKPQAATAAPSAAPTDLAAAPSRDLLNVYAQLRSLQGSDLSAVTENVVWKRDSALFTFTDGRLTFAAPVAGHVVAAVFTGQGTFELDPPTAMDRHQLERFTKEPKLEENFREATFFFTDNSWDELQKLVNVRPGGDAAAATKALDATQRKFSEHFNSWWENESKDYPVMRNLPARMLADLSDPSSHGIFLADIKGDHYGGLLFEISWNRDLTLLPFFASDEEVMLMRYKHGEYSEWWSGFHLKDEYARTPHPEHRTLLAHCSDEHIDAEVSKDNHVSATADMQFEVPAATARVLPMSLQGVLRVSSVTDGAGKKLSFIQEDRKLDSDLWVILPEPAKAGATYNLKISYDEDSTRDSRIIHQQGTGLYFVGARESWYPSFGAFDDRTHFTLDFHSPKKYEFVATGHLVSSKKGDELDTRWESEMPYSVVGFNYGDFVSKSHSDPNLTVTVYGGREIPDELKNLSAAMDLNDFQRGGRTGGASSEAQTGIMRGGFNTTAMVGHAADVSYGAFRLYAFYFGPLPFKTVSVTEQPVGFFGQSWPTLIFLPYLSLIDKTTLNSLGLQQSAEAREFFDTVAMHEMSHQWWGHMVGWKTYHDQWLSEGFANFSAALYLKQLDPKRFRGYWDLRRKWVLSGNAKGHRPTDVDPLWMNYQANAYLEGGNSQRLIYDKGSCVLEMLRAIMEDPKQKYPDGAFINMMRDFVSTYAGKNASTQDFQKVVEKHFGKPMGWFFDEWVYGTAVPHYELKYNVRDAGGKTDLHVDLSQSEVPDNFFMEVPLYANVDGETRRLGFIGLKGVTTFTHDVTLQGRVDKVWLDEYHSILSSRD